MPHGRLCCLSFVGASLLLLSACEPTTALRGNLPAPERLSQIEPGVTTKERVTHILGTPSSVATFDPDIWYYISRRTEQIAWTDPETVDQQVYIVSFNDKGVVKEVKKRGLEDRQVIEPVAKTTPSPGREMGFFEQLIGNLGRFNPVGGQNSRNTGHTGPGG